MKEKPAIRKARLLIVRGYFVIFTVGLPFLAMPFGAAGSQLLHDHIPSVVARLTALGRVPPSTRLDLAISLPLRNQAALSNLLQQIYNPASTNFHQYLTPEQFAERFGPTESDYQTLIQFAQTSGLAITGTYSNRTLLDVSGNVGDIERIFHVTLHTYRHPVEPRTFYAPDVEPSVDLTVPLLGVAGLDNYYVPQPGGRPQPPDNRLQAGPGGGSSPGGYYWGNDIRAAYVPGTTLNGSGQAVGLLELDGYYLTDISAYEASNGISPVTLQNVPLNGFSGNPSTNANWVGEVSLDIEVAIAMAPGLSKVIVYEATNSGTTFLNILSRMASDNAAKQLSSSWFIFDNPSADQYYLQFAAQGQSFFQCSGDFGAFYAGISQWTDNPNVTLAGGSSLNTTGPGGAYTSETVWNNNDGINGSGGGISLSSFGNYSIPGWQQGINMAGNNGSTTKRNIPDISMLAQNAYIISNNGNKAPWWGTSIAAPLWAGFTALVNQQAVVDGKPTMGFLNPALYAIGEGSGYTTAFHDVSSGNNTNNTVTTLYSAVAGYDLCTGLGTPNGTNLIRALENYAGPIFVNFGYAGVTQNGAYNTPYPTLAQATNAVAVRGTIIFETSGSSPSPMTISKPMTITSMGGAVSVGH
jgi:subtilase family serine protease